MTETIESFVSKLQNEGVQAGKEQAGQITTEAQAQADKVIKDAQQEAQKIISDAEAQAQSILQRGETELKLASRDAMLKLRDSIAKTIDSAVRKSTQEKISDPDFLSALLKEMVTLTFEGKELTVNVSEAMKDKIASWEISQLENVDLQAQLKACGFEYTTPSGTVEVTLDSVTEAIRELVGTRLREIISDSDDE